MRSKKAILWMFLLSAFIFTSAHPNPPTPSDSRSLVLYDYLLDFQIGISEFPVRGKHYLGFGIPAGGGYGWSVETDAFHHWFEALSPIYNQIEELRVSPMKIIDYRMPRDSHGIPLYKPPLRHYVGFTYFNEVGRYYHKYYWFNKFEELPPELAGFLSELYSKGVEALLVAPKLEFRERENPYEVNKTFLERCPELIRSVAEKLKRGEISNVEAPAVAEATCKNVEMAQKVLEENLNTYGRFTPAERAQMKAFIEYQETRCARMPFEVAKKDFECRSIQIRDYLRYGANGAPPEELRRRAGRSLAPEPPKLPQNWEISGDSKQ